MTTVVVSGGFDPFHAGHVAFFRKARLLGDRLVVVVESDAWVAKKHPVLQTQADRATMLLNVGGVDGYLLNNREDGNCADLVLKARELYPENVVYAVGGDHGDATALPEYAALTAAGISIARVHTDYQDRRSSKMLEAVSKPRWENPIPMVAAVLDCGAAAGGVLLGVRPPNGGLELPGGFVERGELLEDAVRREVFEETGRPVRHARFFASVVGKYSDGRDIVVAGFRGAIVDPPKVTPEMPAHRFVTAVPDEPFDNDVDRQLLALHFGRWRAAP